MYDRRLVASSARLAAVALLAVACTAGPSPSPTASPGPALSTAELKYALLDRFGQLSWCDPDLYPIAHAEEQALASQRIGEIRADAETYAAILDRLAIDTDAELSDAQVLAVYRDWKLINAVTLTPVAAITDAGAYLFDLVFVEDDGLGTGTRHAGTIARDGTVASSLDEDTFLVSCPICLSRGTLIDTPAGPLPVESLRVGDLVWTLDAGGRRVAAPLVRTGSVAVPVSHQVVRLLLDDGRAALVSAGHPLPDGRRVGDLRPGDAVDGATVVSADLVGYDGGLTYDLLPAGGTGFYWAGGILLASTLR